jgi:hypothetical protein
MIVFQLTPCRIYPKIIELVSDQFPESKFIHEVFEFKKTINLNENPLRLTPNNHEFKRCDFLYGIFNEAKIKKQNDDFWFTIKLPEKRVLQEFFCATKHYGSRKFGFLSKHDTYNLKLHELIRPLSNFRYDEFESHVKNKKINKIINDEIYNIRENIVANGHFDYVGDFDNWRKTIEDIKKIIGLDLSSLAKERLYSYKD